MNWGFPRSESASAARGRRRKSPGPAAIALCALLGGTVLGAAVPGGAAQAQQSALPGWAYDMVAVVTMANTADAKCEGVSMKRKKMEQYLLKMYRKLAQEGVAPGDAAAVLQGPVAARELAAREKTLRERHGVAAEGDAAMCKAIMAEAASNKDLASMLVMP